MVTPVTMESLLGYHPCSIGFLTYSRDPAGGQCLAGSLTGAVASERDILWLRGQDSNLRPSGKNRGSFSILLVLSIFSISLKQ